MRVIEVNNIPQDMYIKAKQRFDLCDIQINGAELKNSVTVTSKLTGLSNNISRSELVKNYTWLDNRKIVLMGCRKKRTYTAKKHTSAPCRAVCVPTKSIIKYSNGDEEKVTTKSPSFLIFDDRYDQPFLIGRQMFRKAYTYDEKLSDVVQRINRIGKSEPTKHQVKVVITKPSMPTGTGMNPKPQTPIMYKAIARYMHGKELIGFKILASTGECKDINLVGTAKLAQAEKIVNLSFSVGTTNKAHFRGKGMSISEIPVIYK